MLSNKDYFNSMAEKWDYTVKHDEGKIKNIMDIVQIKRGSRVLDVGTGTGVMIPILNSYVSNTGKIIAVDEAEKMIEIAKKKYNYKNVNFITGDVLKIKLPENYFDLINCYSMFPHFHDQKVAVKKLARYLKKDGKFVISHSQSREAINNLHKQVSDVIKNDSLPSMDKIKEYYNNAAIEMISKVDNEDMFVAVGVKSE